MVNNKEIIISKPKGTYNCKICKVIIKSNQQMLKHFRDKHTHRTCERCEYRYADSDDFISHKMEHDAADLEHGNE